MILRTPEVIDNLIEEYLDLGAAVKSAKKRQDEIKLALQSNMVRRQVTQIVSIMGIVKRITLAKSVSMPGSQVYELAGVWDRSSDPIFKQCGQVLINLAKFTPERRYLRISAPK